MEGKRMYVCLGKERASGNSRAGNSTNEQSIGPMVSETQGGASCDQQLGDTPGARPSSAAPRVAAAGCLETAGLAPSAKRRNCKGKTAGNRAMASDAKCSSSRLTGGAGERPTSVVAPLDTSVPCNPPVVVIDAFPYDIRSMFTELNKATVLEACTWFSNQIPLGILLVLIQNMHSFLVTAASSVLVLVPISECGKMKFVCL